MFGLVFLRLLLYMLLTRDIPFACNHRYCCCLFHSSSLLWEASPTVAGHHSLVRFIIYRSGSSIISFIPYIFRLFSNLACPIYRRHLRPKIAAMYSSPRSPCTTTPQAGVCLISPFQRPTHTHPPRTKSRRTGKLLVYIVLSGFCVHRNRACMWMDKLHASWYIVLGNRLHLL